MKEEKIKTYTLKIRGMTCVSCENRIERGLKNIDGVISAKADFGTGILKITTDNGTFPIKKIEKRLFELGYEVNHAANSPVREPLAVRSAGVIIMILAVFMFFNHIGGIAIFESFPEAEAGMGFGLLFLIGLLTSVHCVAMCGGINLSQCASYQKVETPCKGRFTSLLPSLQYNGGRVLSYTLIGGIVGAAGSVISFSGGLKGIVVIVAGIFMIIMGLNMLNIFPELQRFNPRIPRSLAVKIHEKKKGKRPFYVGLLNGLMPCGPLQAMQLYALSTGDPFEGALSMFLFSLGTVPLMFGLGAISTLLTNAFQKKMISVSAGLVVILGILMLSNGFALAGIAAPGIPIGSSGQGSTSQIATAVLEDGVQVVNTNLSPRSYEPIQVQSGIPVKWNIVAESSSINGCNNVLVIPEYGIEKQLQPGDNIIEFTPEEEGTIPFSCWMGMIRSQIIVGD